MKLVFFVLFAVITTARSQDDKLYPSNWKLPSKVTLPPHGQKQLCNWCKPFYPGYPSKAVLHAVVHKGDTDYVLFSTDQPRNERFIQWVAIRNGDLAGYQRHTLQSNWRPISGTIEGWTHGILSWHAEGGFMRGDEVVESYYAAFFDIAAPDKGLQIRETYPVP